ncbi:hypothetical protein ILYODFUR_038025 [Ilyodon furcidens]|uniref:Uncharacterized protein n=1 Tax=Ilyodon furcidens TaxID=33524 RepID=A0ABV0U4Y8_9TELE
MCNVFSHAMLTIHNYCVTPLNAAVKIELDHSNCHYIFFRSINFNEQGQHCQPVYTFCASFVPPHVKFSRSATVEEEPLSQPSDMFSHCIPVIYAIHPSLTSNLVFAEKHPYSMMLPPCFTEGGVF